MLNTITRVLKRRTWLEIRFEVMTRFARLIIPEYRFKGPNVEWWCDEAFTDYLHKFDELNLYNADRHWMLLQLTRLVDCVPGDTAECGVYQGAGSYLICKANSQSRIRGRNHFMFDSFEGLSSPSSFDGKHWSEGDMACDLDTIKKNLAEFKNICFLKGWIPDRFTEVQDKRFSFVHIDVDLYKPTHDSIEFFYPRINNGGIIVCDDYWFDSCPGATQAVDEYLADKPEKMVILDSGGGFLIKGCETAGNIPD